MKNLFFFLALGLLVFGPPAAKAQDDAAEAQPVVVVSFSGYAELKRDIEYIGGLSGNPDMAAGLEQLLILLTQGQGLAGVDQARPWGAAVSITADGSQFPALAFLPVTDLSKLLDALAGVIGEAVDAGDDIYEIKRNTNSYFITQKGKWAYVAQQKSSLDDLPGDPLKQLRGLDKEYDLALSLNVQNIPQALRDMGADTIMQAFEARLMQGMDDDDDDDDAEEQNELRTELARDKAEQFVKSINELDQLTVGLNIDRAKSRTFIDLELTALPGSELAKQFAASSEEAQGTRFSGVLLPEALLSLHLNSPISADDEEEAEALFERLSTQLAAEIDKEEDLDDAQKQAAKELAAKLIAIVEDTVEEQGRLNAGLTVLGEGPLTMVLGCLVADATELEVVVKQLVELVAEDADLSKLKLNVAKHQGFRFHTLTVPVPDDEDNDNAESLRAAFGDPIKVALAFGKDIFYVGVGEDGIDGIKQVIDASAETPAEKLPEMTLALALKPILKLAASKGDDARAAQLAESVGDKDRLRITVEPVDNGVRYRIEAEEGVNKLLGQRLGDAARMGGNSR
ncbi:MAG TPA: hypothetical protein VFI31_16750 [Pirellulales bacterium]|nr:hypothetical protein [Pirellulales bacterium]